MRGSGLCLRAPPLGDHGVSPSILRGPKWHVNASRVKSLTLHPDWSISNPGAGFLVAVTLEDRFLE